MNDKYKDLIKILKRYKCYWKYLAVILILAVAGLVYSASCFFNNTQKKQTAYDVAKDKSTHYESEDFTATNENFYENIEKKETYYVYVCGQVNNPGVYACEQGMRYYEVIQLAGGFTSDANETALNLAVTINDGEKIYVPRAGEEITVSETSSAGGVSDIININTASKEQLMLLPGIGESRALDIIAYRQEYGNFQTIEDIMNVSGIKEAAFAKIKNRIRV
ncbi:MAG: helix-hairpin-helix domain-containing protein [Lachnospira sp.]